MKGGRRGRGLPRKTHRRGEGVFPAGTPRLDDIEYLYKNSGAQGIIHAMLSFCTPYLLEQGSVKRFAAERDIPLVAVEADYSEGDVRQLKTRVEAFVEQLSS